MDWTLWIYSKRQGRWIEFVSFDEDIDRYMDIAQEFQQVMPWAVADASGIPYYWRKGDSPEEIVKGIAAARGAR
jgi:hypothetical protein